jgi:hypothetical protein
MTSEEYHDKANPYPSENVWPQIRKSLHRIENRLEHLVEKLDECLETCARRYENGLTEADFYEDNTNGW